MQSTNKDGYYYKLFRVKRNDGRVTTVSLDPILVTKACQVMGSLKAVGQLVREAALVYEKDMYKNCSGFVSKQLGDAVMQATKDRKALQSQAALSSQTSHISQGAAVVA